LPAASGLAIFKHTRSDGSVVQVGQSQDTSQAFVETKDLNMGSEEFYKFLEHLVVDISDRDLLLNMRVTVKFRNGLNEELQTADITSLLNSPDEIPVHPEDAVFYRLRFEDTLLLTRWKLKWFAIFGGEAGRRI